MLLGRSTIAFATLAAAGAAQAQTQPLARAQALRAVTQSCEADVARFCPTSVPGLMPPGAEAMCLKFYKPDLSPRCRAAVRAVRP